MPAFVQLVEVDQLGSSKLEGIVNEGESIIEDIDEGAATRDVGSSPLRVSNITKSRPTSLISPAR